VVDGVDLEAEQHFAHTLGHAVGDVVDAESDSLCHMKNIQTRV
jgi:hypothetical protein